MWRIDRVTGAMERCTIGTDQQAHCVSVPAANGADGGPSADLRRPPTYQDYLNRQTGGPVTVTAPNGKTYTFPNQAAADEFKRTAGIP